MLSGLAFTQRHKRVWFLSRVSNFARLRSEAFSLRARNPLIFLWLLRNWKLPELGTVKVEHEEAPRRRQVMMPTMTIPNRTPCQALWTGCAGPSLR
jgi:hypothetical protein